MEELLQEYNKKRDFNKTREPGGVLERGKSKKLIFVVQEHHASHLHYDFRLEMEGVLKSWAVPKGPSQDPADKRLAVMTEDHPIPYAKFHGTIPKGEYGGGEVYIWDNGTWECEEEDPVEALRKGRIEFTLKGKKLKGKWILVRTRYKGNDSGKNWLLIKRHDDDVKRAKKSRKKVTLKEATPKKTAKKKVPDLGQDPWPGFIAPQLPRLVVDPPEGDNWIFEMKFDGYRMQAHIQKSKARILTRKGLDWSDSFPVIQDALAQLPVDNIIIDGEIVALDDDGSTSFQKLQYSLTEGKDKNLKYFIFDVLYLNGKDLRSLPLIERKKLLEVILADTPELLRYSDHHEKDGDDFFSVSCNYKLEGIVAKKSDSTYSSGRNDLWVKVKCSSRQEFVIGGWTDAKGERKGFGALLLGLYEDGKFRYVGRVGTGFNNQTLKEIKKILLAVEQEKSPFDINSPRGNYIHWADPVKVAEVGFSQWTADRILRTPVFMGLREDKPAEEIHMEKTSKSPSLTKSKTKINKKTDVSSPEKVIFKKEGITKQEIADFYQAISKVMLPYMADRPLSLVRCPHGSEGKCFFQKHVSGDAPKSFNTFPVEEDKGEGIYISINSPEGLKELVQLNAFELHAWNCHKDSYMRPDQIVMDFDPDDEVEWKEVVEGAFELKEILDDLNLKSFVKLTGGKGIHVHIPIAPIYDWDQIKSFSQTLARELVSRAPDRYVAKMSKKIRKGKIFVDYLRNGYGATAVVPYSLRAKETSAIALPLSWPELKRVKSSQDFPIKKALKKIKSRKEDPWKGMLKLKQKISILKPTKKKA